MRCVECGAPVAEVTQVCADCGAPPAGQRPVAADRAAGPSDDLETARAELLQLTPRPTPQDRAGTTRILCTERRDRVGFNSLMAAAFTLFFPLAVFAGAGHTRGPGLIMGALIAAGWWFCYRMMRRGVEVSDGKVTIRNQWRSHTVSASDIRAVTLVATVVRSEVRWLAGALLTNDEIVPLDGLGCGNALRSPDPAALAKLEKFRALLGVGVNSPTGYTPMRCAECGAPVTALSQDCAECGAPPFA